MRIARAHLDAKVETINRITGSPLTGWERVGDRNVARIGHYTISSHAPGDRYGTRYSLTRIMNDGGGETTIIPTVCGGEAFADALSALIRGIEIGKNISLSTLEA